MRRTLPALLLGMAAVTGCAALSAARLSQHSESVGPLFLLWLFAPITLLAISVSKGGDSQPLWVAAVALGAVVAVATHFVFPRAWALRVLTVGSLLWFWCMLIAIGQFV